MSEESDLSSSGFGSIGSESQIMNGLSEEDSCSLLMTDVTSGNSSNSVVSNSQFEQNWREETLETINHLKAYLVETYQTIQREKAAQDSVKENLEREVDSLKKEIRLLKSQIPDTGGSEKIQEWKRNSEKYADLVQRHGSENFAPLFTLKEENALLKGVQAEVERHCIELQSESRKRLSMGADSQYMELRTVQQKCDELTDRVTNLEEENSAYSEKCSVLQECYRANENKLIQIKEERDSLIAEISGAKKLISDLEASVEQLTKENSKHLENISTLQLCLHDAETKFENLVDENEACRREIQSKNAALKRCITEKEATKIKEENEALQAALEEKSKRLSFLRDECLKLRQNRSNKMERIHILEMRGEIISLNDSNKLLKEENQQLREDLDCVKENSRTASNLEQIYSNNLNVLTSVHDLCLDIQVSMSNSKELLIDDLKNKYEPLLQNYSTLLSGYEELQSAINDRANLSLKEEENKLQLRIASLFSLPNVSFDDALTILKEKITSYDSLMGLLEEERTKSRNLDQECDFLDSRIKYLESELEKAWKQHAESEQLAPKEEKKKEIAAAVNDENVNKSLKQTQIDSSQEDSESCCLCAKLREELKTFKLDKVYLESEVSSLQIKAHKYRSQLIESQSEVEKCGNKILDLEHQLWTKPKECVKCSTKSNDSATTPSVCSIKEQTDLHCSETLKLELSARPSSIVEGQRVKELLEQVKQLQKSKIALQKLCQSKAQQVKELKAEKCFFNKRKEEKRQRIVLRELHENS